MAQAGADGSGAEFRITDQSVEGTSRAEAEIQKTARCSGRSQEAVEGGREEARGGVYAVAARKGRVLIKIGREA